ncbi:MAG: acyl--CoA ligase [Gemmatimonadota bacterium]|nr:acyl--CoA ligase [Gemmatimonadota bacterium]
MTDWPGFPRSPDSLRFWSKLSPGRTALVDRARDTRQSYAELTAAADRWAGVLQAKGVKRGDRIAVVAGNRHEVAELFFACGRVGAALVPLNWRLAPVELKAIIEHAQPVLLIGEGRFRGTAEYAISGNGSPIEWIDLDSDAGRLLAASPTHERDVETAANDAVLILYTSGSTGQPKGVIIPNRQILYNAIATTTAWELGPTDIAPVSTPFFHTGGWNVFATPLWHRGGRVVLFDGFDAAAFLEGFAEEKCTVGLTVPTQLVMMRESSRWGIELPALRFLACGGAPCPPSLSAEVRASGYTLREGYGLTECGPNCFAISDEEAVKRPGTVGWPVPFLEMKLETEDGREAESEASGELLLRGPQMFGGYLHDPERTADALAPGGWLRTGDLARRASDGAYSISGRRKEMFISGGENVFPGEVESVLCGHPGVSEVVVAGVSDPLWGEVGRAYVVRRQAVDSVTGENLIAFARTRLAGYKVPRSVVFLDELPRLGSGKPDRRALSTMQTESAGAAQ